MTDYDELVKALRDFDETRDFIPPPTIQLDAADAIEQLTRELDEQARLNGMGAEREAKLLAERNAAERKVEKLRERMNELKFFLQCGAIVFGLFLVVGFLAPPFFWAFGMWMHYWIGSGR